MTTISACPACGPVASDQTSRYCAAHLRALRLQYRRYLARRAASRRPLQPAHAA